MLSIDQLFQVSAVRRHVWIAWGIFNLAVRLLSAGAEIFVRRNFGRRYLLTLFAVVALYLLCAAFAPRPTGLRPLFFMVLTVLTISHTTLAFARRRLGAPEPHSFWAGDSWDVWQRFQFHPTLSERALSRRCVF